MVTLVFSPRTYIGVKRKLVATDQLLACKNKVKRHVINI